MELLKNKEKNEGLEFIKIEESPFTVLKKGDVFNILIGNRLATDKEFDSLEDVKKFIDSKHWDLLSSFMITIYNYLKSTENENS